MAQVIIVDMTACDGTADLEAQPLGWRCAAEMTRCASATVSAELWRSTVKSSKSGRSDEEESGEETSQPRLRWHSFPLPITAVNRYFSVDIEAIVGVVDVLYDKKRRQSYQREEISACIKDGLELHLGPRSARTSVTPTDTAYGCIVLVDARSSPDSLPWHVIPTHASLFSAVLVCTTIGAAANAARKEMDTRAAQWQASCVANQFECILWPARAEWQPTPEKVGSIGLLDDMLDGTARVAQILCNTLWPASLQRQKHQVEATTRFNESSKEAVSTLIVVAGGSSEYLSLVRSSFALPCAGAIGQDVRFFTDVAGRDTESCEGATPSSDLYSSLGTCQGPCATQSAGAADPKLSLVNRYYTATVQPILLHAALFDRAMLDIARQQLQRAITAATAHAMVKRNSDCNSGDGDSADGIPVLVYWPPNGGTDETAEEGTEQRVRASSSFVYPPLAAVLETLQAMPGIGEIAAVTGVRPATLMKGSSRVYLEPTHKPQQQQRRDLQKLRKYDRLDAFDMRMCEAKGVEVISLVSRRRNDLAASTEGSDPLSGERETATGRGTETSDAEGPVGPDRLREFLHCQQWPTAQSRSAATVVKQHACSLVAANCCSIAVFGGCAEEEERWLRSILACCVSDAHPTSARAQRITCATGDSCRTVSRACRTIPSVALKAAGGLCVHVENKYFTASVALQVSGGGGGGVEGRLARDEKDSLRLIETVCTSRAPVTVIVSSRALLKQCSERVANQGTENGRVVKTLGELLRAAQTRLAAAWESGLAGITGEAYGNCDERRQAGQPEANSGLKEGGQECVCLLYVVDLMGENKMEMEDVHAHLRTILSHTRTVVDAGHHMYRDRVDAYDSSNTEEACEDDFSEASFPLIEVIAGNELDWPQPSSLSTATSNPVADDAGDGPHGFARLVEVLAQYPWLVREERMVAGVPRPTFVAAASTSSEASPADPPPSPHEATSANALTTENEIPSEAAARKEAAVVIGCALPPHYLVDPTTLRSEAVPALLFFQRRSSLLAQPPDAAVDAGSSEGADPHAKLHHEKRMNEPKLEHRMQDDLLAWMDKMKVHGHHLTHAQRQHQAAVLAEQLEQILS